MSWNVLIICYRYSYQLPVFLNQKIYLIIHVLSLWGCLFNFIYDVKFLVPNMFDLKNTRVLVAMIIDPEFIRLICADCPKKGP